MTLKSCKELHAESIRPLIALVAIYYDFLEKPRLSEKLILENDGVNFQMFREFYHNSNQLFKRVQDTKKILFDDGIKPENIVFAKALVAGLDRLPLSSFDNQNEAVQTIFDFVRNFIRFYEANFSIQTNKRFFFLRRSNNPSNRDRTAGVEPPAEPPKPRYVRSSKDFEQIVQKLERSKSKQILARVNASIRSPNQLDKNVSGHDSKRSCRSVGKAERRASPKNQKQLSQNLEHDLLSVGRG